MDQSYSQSVDIQQYWLVLKRRWPFVVAVLFGSLGLSGLALFKQRPEYQATGMLLFKSDRISSLTKAGEKIGDLESLMREGNPLDTQAVIVNSEPILKEVIENLQLEDEQGNLLEPESLSIKVEPIVGTDILKVSHTSEKPGLAASVVNEVMTSYVGNNIESNKAQVVAASEFIKEQVPSAHAELERAAEALRLFKKYYKVIELKQEAAAAVSNVAQLDEEMNRVKAALAEAQAREAKVSSQLNLAPEQTVEITSLSQIPGVQEVLSEVQKVQTKLAAERARFTEDHPSIAYLKNEEATLNNLLEERIEKVVGSKKKISSGNLQIGKIRENLANQYVDLQAQREGLEKKAQAMSEIQATYQRRLAILPDLEKKQGDLERRLSVAQSNYQNLLNRLQEIKVAENQTIGNAKVIQTARVPKKPVLSKVTLLLAAGGVFVGLLVGIAVAFFADTIDRSLKTVKEAEAFFDYTMLGIIPKFESNSMLTVVNLRGNNVSPRIIVASHPHTVIHEAYQMLQANLMFISDTKIRTIVVTSSVAGEGKSEVSANLTAMIAQAGRRVLLVDANMRQPAQHHLWGVINSVGLSNVIVGQEEFSNAVIHVAENLSVLTAGVQPPNPTALIDSKRMKSLINMFYELYDYVIFDTPALVRTADAAVLGKMVDGVLLVTRPGVVESASATAAKSLLARSDASILGIIANGVNLKQEPDSYFYYSNRSEQGVETKIGEEQWMYK